MKILIFLDRYNNKVDLYKCSGQTALGLQEFGCDVVIVGTINSSDQKNNSNSLFISVGQQELLDPIWWKEQHADVVIFYSWLQSKYNPIIQIAKNAGLKIILKLDSDGRIAPIGKPYKGFIYNLSRNIKQRLLDTPAKILQVALADALIIESPAAATNLAYCFNFWTNNRGKHLIDKLHVVGNPVTTEFVTSPVNRFKTRSIVSIGRWNSYQKNKPALIFTVNHFLNQFLEYPFTIVGKGVSITDFDSCVRKKISICESLPHEKIGEYLSTAKILFMPSMFEGMPISGGEALCSGCSICGTPLESLIWLTQGGSCGTTASDFTKQSILSALELDVNKWENGYYVPESISQFWRPRLRKETIAKQILDIIK